MENFWSTAENTQPVRIWCGLAFERVALQHENQIKSKLGEKATITVAAFATNKVPLASGKVKWRLNNFGDTTISKGTFDVSKGVNTFSVDGTMNEPGFMRLNVTELDEQGNPGKTQFFGVAYSCTHRF